MIRRYLFLGHMALTLKVLAFVLVALSLGQFTDAFQAFRASDSVSALTVLWRAVLRTPSLLQYALPHVMIIATVLHLHQMGSQRELAIMAGIGRSARHLLAPLALSGLLFGAGYVFVVNPLASAALAEAERIEREVLQFRADSRARNVAVDQPDGGTLFVFARGVSATGGELQEVTVIEVTPRQRVRRRLDFDRATRRADGGWDIEGLRETRGLGTPEPVEEADTLPFDPEWLLRRLPERQAVSVYDLPATAAFAETVAHRPLLYRFQFIWLLALPVFLASVCYLTGSVALHLAFHRSWGRRAVEVILLAFPVYALVTVTEALAIRGIVAPLAVAVAAPLLLYLTGRTVIRWRRI